MANIALSNPTIDGYVRESFDRFAGEFFQFGHSAIGGIDRGFVEWDISGIPNGSTITLVVFKYHCYLDGTDGHIHEMLGVQPSGEADDAAGNQAIYDEAGEGTVYYDAAGFPELGTQKSADLGAQACTDLQSQLGSDWFAIGFQGDNEAGGSRPRIRTEERVDADPKPTLYVEYTPAGWAGGDVGGVAIATIAKINGVALADIEKVNGVA